MYVYTRNGNVLIAQLKSGRQIYPSDAKGNAFYPVNRENKPFYLKDENDIIYPAKRKNNSHIYIDPPILSKKYVKKKRDAIGNIVYMIKPKINSYYAILDVLCLCFTITTSIICLLLLFL